MNEQRKLAAIMFTDMVGYSSMTQKNEKLAMELLEEHRRILRGVFAEYHGTEIKTIGDAFLASFDSALSAVHAAIAIQHALENFNETAPQTIKIQLRIGIHLGDLIWRDGDVYGDGVNIASRVQSVSESGGICISEDVYRQVRNKLDVSITKLGRGDLKNIAIGVGIYKINLTGETGAGLVHKAKFLMRQPRVQVGAMVVVLLLIIVPLLTRALHGKSEKKNITVLVADFVNETSDKNFASLDEKVTGLFVAPLEQSEKFSVMTRAKIRETLKQMKRENPKRVTESLGRDVCKYTDTPVLVIGYVKKFGTTFTVDAKALDPIRNIYLVTAAEEAKSIDSIPAAVSRVASAVRLQLESQSETLRPTN
jgi:adenylate cyclase